MRLMYVCSACAVCASKPTHHNLSAGRIYTDPNLPEVPPADRARVYQRLANTLADLHSLNPDKLGLSGFGNPTNYCRRQVRVVSSRDA